MLGQDECPLLFIELPVTGNSSDYSCFEQLSHMFYWTGGRRWLAQAITLQTTSPHARDSGQVAEVCMQHKAQSGTSQWMCSRDCCYSCATGGFGAPLQQWQRLLGRCCLQRFSAVGLLFLLQLHDRDECSQAYQTSVAMGIPPPQQQSFNGLDLVTLHCLLRITSHSDAYIAAPSQHLLVI